MTEAMDLILQLKSEKFVDLGTRAIFIDFTVYNAYLKLYNVVRFSMEFPATGGVIPKRTYRAVQIEKYTGFNTVFFLEIVLVVFVICYFMQEMMEIANEGSGYFKNPWNFMDITNLVIFLVVICLRLYTTDMVYGVLGVTQQLPPLRATSFPNLQKVAFLMNQETNLNAMNAWIMWCKLFKCVSLSLSAPCLHHALPCLRRSTHCRPHSRPVSLPRSCEVQHHRRRQHLHNSTRYREPVP
jgi:hypothetical protein